MKVELEGGEHGYMFTLRGYLYQKISLQKRESDAVIKKAAWVADAP